MSGHAVYGRRRQRGFSLIEMLAAFVVFAIGFGVMMELSAASLHNARRGAELTEAALWAQSKLDLAGIDAALQPGTSSGEFDRKYHWELDVREWQPPSDAAQLSDPGALSMLEVELVVRWGEGAGGQQAKFVALRAIQPDPLAGAAAGAGAGADAGGDREEPK
ncbi:MAG: prepilin-type N-terminal cleavage/methylation domain-containing protein [Lysobacterales bacterium]